MINLQNRETGDYREPFTFEGNFVTFAVIDDSVIIKRLTKESSFFICTINDNWQEI